MTKPVWDPIHNYSRQCLLGVALVLLTSSAGCDGDGEQASQPGNIYHQQLEAFSARLSSLDNARQEQTTVLRQILDRLESIAPAKIPPEGENSLRELNALVKDRSQWPTNPTEAERFLERTTELVTSLPAWAEAHYLTQVSTLRWTAMAFTLLSQHDDTHQPLDQLANEMRELSDAKPAGAPEELVQRLRETATEFDGKATNRRVVAAIEQAQRYLKGSPDVASDIAGLYDFLGLYETQGVVGVDIDIASLRMQVYSELVQRQADEQVSILRVRWQNLRDLARRQPPPPIYEVSVKILFQQVLSAHAALVLEGIEAPVYDDLESELRRAVEDIESAAAERVEKRQAEAMRSYQKWALSKVKAFEAAFKITADKAAQSASLLLRDDGGWTDAYYREVRQAMIEHLLPINIALLDMPVQERSHRAFQTGWKKLDGREDQITVAQASALAHKKSLRAFLEN